MADLLEPGHNALSQRHVHGGDQPSFRLGVRRNGLFRHQLGDLVSSILLIGFSCTAFALAIGVLAIVIRDWLVISAAASGLLIVFTGVVIPVSDLPFHLNYLGNVLPLTHGVAAFREAFDGAGPLTVGGHLFWELAVGICYGLFGFLLFRFVEVDARRRGAYETSIL